MRGKIRADLRAETDLKVADSALHSIKGASRFRPHFGGPEREGHFGMSFKTTFEQGLWLLAGAALVGCTADVSGPGKGSNPAGTAGSGDRDNWQPYDIIGHYIYAEEADWIPRAKVILAQADDRTFPPFDRYGQFERPSDETLADRLDEFARIRAENIEILRSWELVDEEPNRNETGQGRMGDARRRLGPLHGSPHDRRREQGRREDPFVGSGGFVQAQRGAEAARGSLVTIA